MKALVLIATFITLRVVSLAQSSEVNDPLMLNLAEVVIVNGDTNYIVNLPPIEIWSTRYNFNAEQQSKLYRYRVYASYVRPFAVSAVQNYREIQIMTAQLSGRDRKKIIKERQQQLEKQFSDNIKKLSKTQGKILMKMIEKELNKSTFDILKELKGGFSATYWSTLGLVYDHHLKRGYIVGEDPFMDIVLQQYSISSSN